MKPELEYKKNKASSLVCQPSLEPCAGLWFRAEPFVRTVLCPGPTCPGTGEVIYYQSRLGTPFFFD